jgi:hypothetical protein
MIGLILLLLCSEADAELTQLRGQLTGLARSLEKLERPTGQISPAQLLELARKTDCDDIHKALEPHVLFVLNINPESRVKVARGKAMAELAAGKSLAFLVRVDNTTGTAPLLRVGVDEGIPADMLSGVTARIHADKDTPAKLTGATVDYRLVCIEAKTPGRREALFRFDVGQGTQDVGFRGEVAVLFKVTDKK